MNPPTVETLAAEIEKLKVDLKIAQNSGRRLCFAVWVIVPMAFLLGGTGWAVWSATQQQGGNLWACVAMYAIFSAAMIAILLVFSKALSEICD